VFERGKIARLETLAEFFTMRETEDSASRMTALVAIIRAARLTHDRELELSAKRELSERFGIKLTFANDPKLSRREESRNA
jgi:hypothetical protein